MNGQNFLQLSLPTFLTNEAKGYVSINQYTAGANALRVVSDCFRLHKEYKVWVMRIYGDPLSWVLKYSINQQIPGNIILRFDKPLGMRKDGQILWTTKEGYLISYDHEDPAENLEEVPNWGRKKPSKKEQKRKMLFFYWLFDAYWWTTLHVKKERNKKGKGMSTSDTDSQVKNTENW
ncbi:hypothetical protein HAX54_015704 [Datura stramonium]|uniref:Uncharacterized protein n=1 Tax=Datura stramonium TaxID=4076 RepID=A0ABS8UHJ9_DATST|nr:hypothetical protein [Datura stramonium]